MTRPAPTDPASDDARPRPGTRLTTLAFWRDLALLGGLIILGLSVGASLLIPLFFALLLFVLLTAVTDWIGGLSLTGMRCPGWLASLIGVALVVFGLIYVMLIFGRQAGAVAAAIPAYEARLDALLARLVALVGDGNAAMVKRELAGLDLSSFAVAALQRASSFLGSFFLFCLFLPFLLTERSAMWTKIALAAGDARLGAEVHVVAADISLGLRRYVGIKSFVSLLTALLSYGVMKPLGLDFAETWAILAFALNFIPSIGSLVAIALPALVALAQFDTAMPLLVVLGGLGLVQFVIGYVLEPALTGRSLNLSPLMVILALTFWSVIWGISGAFLSVPITVCLLIVFSHLPGTRPWAVLMSGDGRLITD